MSLVADLVVGASTVVCGFVGLAYAGGALRSAAAAVLGAVRALAVAAVALLLAGGGVALLAPSAMGP